MGRTPTHFDAYAWPCCSQSRYPFPRFQGVLLAWPRSVRRDSRDCGLRIGEYGDFSGTSRLLPATSNALASAASKASWLKPMCALMLAHSFPFFQTTECPDAPLSARDPSVKMAKPALSRSASPFAFFCPSLSRPPPTSLTWVAALSSQLCPRTFLGLKVPLPLLWPHLFRGVVGGRVIFCVLLVKVVQYMHDGGLRPAGRCTQFAPPRAFGLGGQDPRRREPHHGIPQKWRTSSPPVTRTAASYV